MTNDRGFSLWEIMAVLAILALLAAIAVPALVGSRNRASMQGALDNLRGDLQAGRSMAIREGTFVVVNFQAGRYEIFVDNGAGANAGNWVRDADERMLRDRRLGNGISIDLVGTDLPGERTRFNDRGLPENLGSVVLADSTGNQRQITINRLGRLNVQ